MQKAVNEVENMDKKRCFRFSVANTPVIYILNKKMNPSMGVKTDASVGASN